MKKIKKVKCKMISNNRGISLVEVMVVAFIFSLMMAGLYTTSAAGQNAWFVNQVRVELQQDLRKAMEWMRDDLRQAGPSSIVDVPADSNTYSQITFKIPSGISGGSVVWETDTIEFDQNTTDPTVLERTKGGVVKIIANNIKTVTFKRDISTPDILEVNLEAEKDTVKGTTIAFNLGFDIQLRNN